MITKIKTIARKIIHNILAACVRFALFLGTLGVAEAAAPKRGEIPGTGGGTSIQFKLDNPINAPDVQSLLAKLVDIMMAIGVPLAILAMIYAGFLYVTARGDETKVATATKTFTWTAVGIAVLLGAKVIAVAIQGTIRQL